MYKRHCVVLQRLDEPLRRLLQYYYPRTVPIIGTGACAHVRSPLAVRGSQVLLLPPKIFSKNCFQRHFRSWHSGAGAKPSE
jgi:hypothetical protein